MSKPRPPNASGPNGLRGGIKTFAPKTITGPWLEELGGSAGYKRGFTSVDYITEAQHQQLSGYKQKIPDFGNELPDDIQIKRPNSPFKYDPAHSFKSTDISPWLTSTKLMGLSTSAKKVTLLACPISFFLHLLSSSFPLLSLFFPSSFLALFHSLKQTEDDKNNVYSTVLKPVMPLNELEDYRKKWTCDINDNYRSLRWQTETLTSLNNGVLNNKFQISTVRMLPGTPKSFEIFRNQLIEKYGILSFIMLKNEIYQITQNNDFINSNEIRVGDFKNIIMKKLNISKVKLHDVNQVSSVFSLSFFSPYPFLLLVCDCFSCR
jgi:hypothetical protein